MTLISDVLDMIGYCVFCRPSINEHGIRMADRLGGYVRVLKKRLRTGDATPMAFVEFVDRCEVLAKAEEDAA